MGLGNRHKPTWTRQKSRLGLVESSRTDSPIPDCQAETKGWELLVLKQKRFGLLGGAPDRFIWNPRGEKTAFIFLIVHLHFANVLCRRLRTPLLSWLDKTCLAFLKNKAAHSSRKKKTLSILGGPVISGSRTNHRNWPCFAGLTNTFDHRLNAFSEG